MQTVSVISNADKSSLANFKEAMTSSYIPTFLPQAEKTNSENFAKEFKRVSEDDRSSKNRNNNDSNLLENKKESLDITSYSKNEKNATDRTDRESSHRLEAKIEKKTLTENGENKNIRNNDDTRNSDNATKKENVENTQKYQDSKNGENQAKESNGNSRDSGSIKAVIEKAQIKRIEMQNVKEDMTENFKEGKKINSSTFAEKILLEESDVKTVEVKTKGEDNSVKNKLANNISNRTEQSDEIKVTEDKSHESSKGEKKESQAQNQEKKDNTTIISNEVKVQQNDTKKESHNLNFLNEFSKNLNQTKNVQINKTNSSSNLLEQYQMFRDKITDNIENSIKLLISSGESKATIQLHPPELGRLQVELIAHENQVTAKINTENIAVKEVIMSNLNQLKSNLENNGTQINKFDVEVGGFKNQMEQDFSNGETGGKRRGRGGYLPSQENDELNPHEVKNYSALTVYLGRSINCLI